VQSLQQGRRSVEAIGGEQHRCGRWQPRGDNRQQRASDVEAHIGRPFHSSLHRQKCWIGHVHPRQQNGDTIADVGLTNAQDGLAAEGSGFEQLALRDPTFDLPAVQPRIGAQAGDP